MFNYRTDFADETIINRQESAAYSLVTKRKGDIKIAEVTIHKKNKILNKEPGNYVSIEFNDVSDAKTRRRLAATVKDYLVNIATKNNAGQKILVVGLGNKMMVADALGPLSCEKLLITNHLYEFDKKALQEGSSALSSISPGVMGQTGLETGKIIQALVDKFKPSLVVVVDSLATRNIERINRVIQISDTGIRPGSGVGQMQIALDKNTLKVPVICIGVATVVDTSSLIASTLELVNYLYPNKIASEEISNLIDEALSSHALNTIVTPKEIDENMRNLSQVIAQAINMSFHAQYDKM